MRGGAAPSALPEMQALRPSKGDGVRLCLTLLPDEKVTKESPRGAPPLGTPLGGHYHPPSNASVAPPRKGCHPMQLNFPEDAADSLPPQPIPLGQKAGESKGVRPLVLGVKTSSKSRTKRSLVSLCLLSSHRPLQYKCNRKNKKSDSEGVPC